MKLVNQLKEISRLSTSIEAFGEEFSRVTEEMAAAASAAVELEHSSKGRDVK